MSALRSPLWGIGPDPSIFNIMNVQDWVAYLFAAVYVMLALLIASLALWACLEVIRRRRLKRNPRRTTAHYVLSEEPETR